MQTREECLTLRIQDCPRSQKTLRTGWGGRISARIPRSGAGTVAEAKAERSAGCGHAAWRGRGAGLRRPRERRRPGTMKVPGAPAAEALAAGAGGHWERWGRGQRRPALEEGGVIRRVRHRELESAVCGPGPREPPAGGGMPSPHTSSRAARLGNGGHQCPKVTDEKRESGSRPGRHNGGGGGS